MLNRQNSGVPLFDARVQHQFYNRQSGISLFLGRLTISIAFLVALGLIVTALMGAAFLLLDASDRLFQAFYRIR